MRETDNNGSLPAGLKKKLAGRIGMEDIHEIIRHTQRGDKEKQKLYSLAFDEDDTVATNALWIMTHFTLHENQWLYQKQDEMTGKLLSTAHPSQKRLLLSLIYRQPLPSPPRVDLLDYCLEEIISRKEPPGTTTLCLKLAYEMCRAIPELLHEYRIVLEMIEPAQLPPSLKTTRKNILKAMQKNKSLQIF